LPHHKRLLVGGGVIVLTGVAWWGVSLLVASTEAEYRSVHGLELGSALPAPGVSRALDDDRGRSRRSSIEATPGSAVEASAQTMTQCLASHGIEVVQEQLAADTTAALHERNDEKLRAIRARESTLDPAKLEWGRLQLEVAELRQVEMLSAFEQGVYVLVAPDRAMHAVGILSREFRNTNVGTHSGLSTVHGSQVVAIVAKRPSAELQRAMAAAGRVRRESPR
jgi:hypothetical protein